MTEVKNMETMIATENQQEATEVKAFLGELEPQEKKDFLVFMQGIRFARHGTENCAAVRIKEGAGMEVQGTFNAQRFFETLALIISQREGVKVTVTVTQPEPEKKEKQSA